MKRRVLILPLTLFLAACSSPNSSEPSGGQEPASSGMYHGHGAPSNTLGNDFEHYYDEDSHYVYEKNGGEWINQFTKGSSSLYSNNTTRAVNENTINKLKSALATSFYSTNATVHMIPHFDDPSKSGWDYKCEFNKRDIKMTMMPNSESPTNYFIKMNTEGVPCVYRQGDGYVPALFGDDTYCMVPHPTMENITFTNHILFDDDLGQQTSIICGHLNKATYNESTKEYIVQGINVSHQAMTTHYFHTPIADNIVIDVRFTLSSDESYVESTFLRFVSSESIVDLNGFTIEYQFTNMHTTLVEMPE